MIWDIIKFFVAILKRLKSSRAFHELVREVMGDDGRLVYRFEVRWLSCGRVWKLREELFEWFNGREDHRAHLIQNLYWLDRVACLVDIFGMLYVLNTTYKGVESICLKRSSKSYH